MKTNTDLVGPQQVLPGLSSDSTEATWNVNNVVRSRREAEGPRFQVDMFLMFLNTVEQRRF